MSGPTAHPVVPTTLRRFVGKEYSGASDDIMRAHHGHWCVVIGPAEGDEENPKFFVRFADDATGIAFSDELYRH